MNKLLVIENEPSEYAEIKHAFEDWQITPNNHWDIEYSNKDSILEFVDSAIQKKGIVAIIIDISLVDDSDDTGLEIIQEIRNINNIKHKIIPIYCYSRHSDKKQEALKKGATNFFHKQVLGDRQSPELDFLKKSLTALAFIYMDACGIAQDLKDFDTIYNKLTEIEQGNNVVLQAILQLSQYDDIISITELNEENSEKIKQIIGEDHLRKLLQEKWFQEEQEKQENLIGEVADILSDIPVLSSIGAILKGIGLISKSCR